MTRVWDQTDFRGQPLPEPVNWATHPEWFDSTGGAVRIQGPRYLWFDTANNDGDWHWGPIQDVYQVHRYAIIRFLWSKHNFGLSQQTDHGTEGFAIWVDGKETGAVYESLDQALVEAVRYKHEGQRTGSGMTATEYFMKMIRP
jgi:hypothetical protein